MADSSVIFTLTEHLSSLSVFIYTSPEDFIMVPIYIKKPEISELYFYFSL